MRFLGLNAGRAEPHAPVNRRERPKNDESSHALCTTLREEDEEKVRRVEINRGDITVHDQRVVHGSGRTTPTGGAARTSSRSARRRWSRRSAGWASATRTTTRSTGMRSTRGKKSRRKKKPRRGDARRASSKLGELGRNERERRYSRCIKMECGPSGRLLLRDAFILSTMMIYPSRRGEKTRKRVGCDCGSRDPSAPVERVITPWRRPPPSPSCSSSSSPSSRSFSSWTTPWWCSRARWRASGGQREASSGRQSGCWRACPAPSR